MNNFFRRIKASIYTERCPYCGSVIDFNEIACVKCKSEFPQQFYNFYAKGGYKGSAAFIYDGIFANAVKNFKFNNLPQYSEKLAIPLSHSIKELLKDTDFDLVTCVPMHKKRERKRGYNQACLLAKDTAQLLNIPYMDLIEKYKDNPPQHQCEGKERKNNVKGVYRAINKDAIKGKNILVIDDIITSGYTLGECCKVLQKAGANVICCGAVCVVVYT